MESSRSQIRNNLSTTAAGEQESGTLLNILLMAIISWKLKSQAHGMLSLTCNRYQEGSKNGLDIHTGIHIVTKNTAGFIFRKHISTCKKFYSNTYSEGFAILVI